MCEVSSSFFFVSGDIVLVMVPLILQESWIKKIEKWANLSERELMIKVTVWGRLNALKKKSYQPKRLIASDECCFRGGTAFYSRRRSIGGISSFNKSPIADNFVPKKMFSIFLLKRMSFISVLCSLFYAVSIQGY